MTLKFVGGAMKRSTETQATIIILLLLEFLLGFFIVKLSSTIRDQQAEISNLQMEIEQYQMDLQLDPCPICDGHNVHFHDDGTHDISIKCDDCGTTFGFYYDPNSALEIWNNVKG